MKKLFSLFAAAIVALAMNATTVTFNFSSASAFGYEDPANGAYAQINSGDTLSQDGVNLIFTYPEGKNGFRFFANTNTGVINLRGYIEGTMVIEAPAGSTINQIVLNGVNCTSTYLSGDITADQWIGSATSLTANVIKSTVQINSMVITLDEEVEPTTPDTIGVTEARARIDAGQTGACYVKGIVVTDPTDPGNYGNTICWLTDIVNTTDSLEGYKISGLNGTSFTTADDIPFIKGDTVLFYASKIELYAAKGIYEINGGYFCEILGAAPRAKTNELVYTSATFSLSAGAADFVLTNGDAATALSLTTTTTSNTPAGVYSLNAQTASFGTADIEEGTLSVSFDHVANGEYFYAFKAAFTVAGVAYKSNDVLKVAGSYPEDITNIDAATAAEIAGTLASGANSDVTYDIYAYVSSEPTTNKSGNQVFYIADDATSTLQVFYCYGVTWTGNAPKIHDMVHVKAQLKNYNGTLETNYGNGEVVTEFPELMRHGTTAEIITVSADQAYNIGLALNNETSGTTLSTTDTYTVIGYCVSISSKGAYDESTKKETFYMADAADAYGNFLAYSCTVDREVLVGDKVKLTGKIQNYCGTGSNGLYNNIEISYASVEHTEDAIPEAVANTVIAAPATKALRNGQVVILKAGQAFNLLGTRL